MKYVYYDDHSHIAESFAILEDHNTRLANLAFHKIHAYKISLSSESFSMNRNELAKLIHTTLLHYVHPRTLLQMVNYFNEPNLN